MKSSEKTHITERSAVAIIMSWTREIIEKHNLDLGLPIVETAGRDNKFPDMEIYASRRSEDCLCVFEAKRPNFDVFDHEEELKEPARKKATERRAKYFVLLNFRKLVWFDTAKVNQMLPEEQQIVQSYTLSDLRTLDDLEATRHQARVKRNLEEFLIKLVCRHQNGCCHHPAEFIRDNALMWLEEYHVDGLRLDMSLFMRNVHGNSDPNDDLPDGWSLIQWINREVQQAYPGRITIAEDLQKDDRITRSVDEGGAGFTAQWGARFVHPVRAAVITPDDAQRSLESVRTAIDGRYNGDPFQRVIYSESHDEIANGKSRVSSEIDLHNPDSWAAQKRTTLAAALVLTSPGIPMLFQGQEFLEDGWFEDSVPLDWHKSKEFSGLVRMYRDLIHLRLNRFGSTRGLTGSGLNTFHQNQADNVIAYHRWHQGGPGDDVVVVVNLSHRAHENYRLGFPSPGTWRIRLNSDWSGYSRGFSNQSSSDVIAETLQVDKPGATESVRRDGFPAEGAISIGPYSVLVYSQDKPAA